MLWDRSSVIIEDKLAQSLFMEAIALEQQILVSIRTLPVQQQHEVLNFAQFLHQKAAVKPPPRRSLKGLGADLKVQITEADIDEARQEMWGNFPREIV
jgi:Protein of unknown function (DUF2281)